MKSCKYEDCPRPLKSRGMCNTHYERWRRNGADGVDLRSLRKPGINDAEMVEFLLNRSKEHESGCVIWQGAKNGTGYGVLGFRNKPWVAHTLMLTLVKGERPEGMEGCHSRECVSRCCINPDHLRWDTRTENLIDAREIGRGPGQKLTRDDVENIRRLKSENDVSVARLSVIFDVDQRHIRKILRGEIWASE